MVKVGYSQTSVLKRFSCLPLLVAGALRILWPDSGYGQTVTLRPGDNIQAAVNAAGTGTTFALMPGIYRNQSIVPKDGDSFIGEPGAVLNGAVVLTSFKTSGAYWVATYKVSQVTAPGNCLSDHPACAYPEDLFRDSKPLQRVTALSAIAPGKWYYDYSTGNIYMADDPTGHLMEFSVTRSAISGSALNVTIRGLVIEKYANPGQSGAIQGVAPNNAPGSGWVVVQNEVRLNHGAGVRSGVGMKLDSNYIHSNGQMGFLGSHDNLLIQSNEFSFNNYAGFTFGMAAGAKFSYTHNLVVRNNYAHDNLGPGLFTDIDNYGALYEGNHTRSNMVGGIVHEISFDAVIRYNLVENDGFTPFGSSLSWGSGIRIYDSSNVEVYGNIVTNCMNGIGARQDDRGSSSNGTPYQVRNLNVHGNIITQTTGIAAGLRVLGNYDNSIFTSWGNRFVNNSYRLANFSGKYYHWEGSELNLDQWQQDGNDVNGTWFLQ
ncbi:MAG TPA: right-handed parallel beta-helix repeat-containing protein [Terriglobia bacterium]|jgi:hypothetical protein|nr:right-handed parallel beta-helix repeat-containing protein [Terriglobia bacterium]